MGLLALISVLSVASVVWVKTYPPSYDPDLVETSTHISWTQVVMWAVSAGLEVTAVLQMLIPSGEPFRPWLGAYLIDRFTDRLHAEDGILQDEPGGVPWSLLEHFVAILIGVGAIVLRGVW